jgi:hypothetical protein
MSSLPRWAVTALLSTAVLLASASSVSAATESSSSHTKSLITSAIAATKSAKSFTIVGIGSSSGETVKIDVTVGSSDALGVLTYGGQSTTVRRVGSAIYAKGTKGFLEQQGASASQAAAEANKWFRIPSSETSSYSNLKEFLTVSGLLSGLVPSTSSGSYSSVKKSTFDGQSVEVITGTFGGQKGALYIATHGKPYLLRVVQDATTSGGGTVTLSHYNTTVRTTAPKGAVTQ